MSIEQIIPAEFAEWQAVQAAAGKQVLLLDVREDWELATASVRPDGTHYRQIPLGQLMGREPELQAYEPDTIAIACLCHHGIRSLRAAHFLQSKGWTQVVNIAGGISAWADLDERIARY